MERNEEHGVRLSTFDFTTDLKPLLGILSLYKQREEISNLCRNLRLGFGISSFEFFLRITFKFSNANSQTRRFKYIVAWIVARLDRFRDFLFLNPFESRSKTLEGYG